MNRVLKVFLILLFGVSGPALAATDGVSLYETLSRRPEVKVYVALPTDVSERKVLDADVLKRVIEKALQGRKSIHFKVVTEESQAELALDTEVKGFLFTENDPVDMLIGVGVAAMDAAVQDHYAAADALFTVRDTKAGKVLWKDEVRATVTHHTMTEIESYRRVSENLAEQLMRKAFGKKKR